MSETASMPSPTRATRSNRNVFVIAIAALLACLCIAGACVGMAGLAGTGVLKVMAERPKVEMTYGSDLDMPQGLVAEVDGMISYADGFVGDFNAVLEQDGGDWRIYSINVNAPVEKFGP